MARNLAGNQALRRIAFLFFHAPRGIPSRRGGHFFFRIINRAESALRRVVRPECGA
jgi:hypothetical protein